MRTTNPAHGSAAGPGSAARRIAGSTKATPLPACLLACIHTCIHILQLPNHPREHYMDKAALLHLTPPQPYFLSLTKQRPNLPPPSVPSTRSPESLRTKPRPSAHQIPLSPPQRQELHPQEPHNVHKVSSFLMTLSPYSCALCCVHHSQSPATPTCPSYPAALIFTLQTC